MGETLVVIFSGVLLLSTLLLAHYTNKKMNDLISKRHMKSYDIYDNLLMDAKKQILHDNSQAFEKLENKLSDCISKFENGANKALEALERKEEEVRTLQQLPIAMHVGDNIDFLYSSLDNFATILESIEENQKFYGDPILRQAIKDSNDILERISLFKDSLNTLAFGEGDDEERAKE